MTLEQVRPATIRMFHVYRHYGQKSALADISLDIFKNEFLFITGPSGAGKTTLLKLLYMGEKPTDGQILLDGINLARVARKKMPQLRRKFGIIFQDFKLLPNKSIYDNVALVLEASGKQRKFIKKKVNSALRIVGMEKRAKATPVSLSGGEQQRVAIARAFVGDPQLILADEPTGSMDPEAADHVFKILKVLHRRGSTVIVATHDHHLVHKYGGRIIYLQNGRMIDQKEIHGQP